MRCFKSNKSATKNTYEDEKKKQDMCMRCLQLRFTNQQLQHLNYYFSDQETVRGDEKRDNNAIRDIQLHTEKLIQRLLRVIGNLDPKFSAQFLVKLQTGNTLFKNSATLSYLIRLDQLSLPSLYPEIDERPTYNVQECDGALQGYGKIRLTGATLRNWFHFVDREGYLRRDKIQRRFVELVATAASRISSSDCIGEEENGSLSAKNGKENSLQNLVVDAEVLHCILGIPPEQRIFYGNNTDKLRRNGVFATGFRITIVEENPSLKLRIQFPSLKNKAKGISSSSPFDEEDNSHQVVVLNIGIGFQGFPCTADYPQRMLFTDCDILLHQYAATTGFYLVTGEPRVIDIPFGECTARVLWRFQFPATEQLLSSHYSEYSVICRVANIVHGIILNFRRTLSGRHVLGKYMIKTLLWFQLERYASEEDYMQRWLSSNLSFHVLSLLDELILALRTRKHRSYFFPDFNIMLDASTTTSSLDSYEFSSSSMACYTEEIYTSDAEILETFVQRIHDLSSSELLAHQSIITSHPQCYQEVYWEKYEKELLDKWLRLVQDFKYNPKNDSTRINNKKEIRYSVRQLEYIAEVLRGTLFVRCLISSMKNSSCLQPIQGNGISQFSLTQKLLMVDHIVFIMSSILKQAKMLYLKMHYSNGKKITSKFEQVVDNTNTTMESFFNDIKNNVKEDLIARDISDDVKFVSYVITYLQSKMHSNKSIRSIMKPYMRLLFVSSQSNSWFLNNWKSRLENDELRSLRVFSQFLQDGMFALQDGLIDAYQKGWDWALAIINVGSEQSNAIELLQTTSDGILITHQVGRFAETMHKFAKISADLDWDTYAFKRRLVEPNHLLHVSKSQQKDWLHGGRFSREDEHISTSHCHFDLQESSPIAYVVDCKRRYGIHRGLGHIINVLAMLGKFMMLQEIAEALPEEKRKYILKDIQRISKERHQATRLSKYSRENNSQRPELKDSYTILKDKTIFFGPSCKPFQSISLVDVPLHEEHQSNYESTVV